MRRIPYVAAALVLAVVPPALAASPVSCRIVLDASHDQQQRRGVNDPQDRPAVDIVSADIATSATHMTTVVRVRALPQGPTQGFSAGYSLLVVGRETNVETSVELLADGSVHGRVRTYDVGESGTTVSWRDLGPAKAELDRVRHEVRATFPLSLVRDYLDTRKGRVIKVLRAETLQRLPGLSVAGDDVSFVSQGADRGEGGSRVYRAGSRSCVRVGS